MKPEVSESGSSTVYMPGICLGDAKALVVIPCCPNHSWSAGLLFEKR